MSSIPKPASQALLDSLAVIAGTRWYHIDDPSSAVMDQVAEHFGIHPLQVEDCRHRRQTARLEEHERYSFVVIKALVSRPGENTLSSGTAAEGQVVPAATVSQDQQAPAPPTAEMSPGALRECALKTSTFFSGPITF